MKDELYTITCTRNQLVLIANCVEDCHRFMAGQLDLNNMMGLLDNGNYIRDKLNELHHLVVPILNKNQGSNSSYSWNGLGCPDKYQRRFIAETYPIYREILHFLVKQESWNNVYSSETLTCEEGGNPVKIERLK